METNPIYRSLIDSVSIEYVMTDIGQICSPKWLKMIKGVITFVGQSIGFGGMIGFGCIEKADM